MLPVRSNIFYRYHTYIKSSKKYSTSGLNRWTDELSSQIKLDIENHWRDIVINQKNKKPFAGAKYYALSMFPYPSGQLHMGHVRVYTISDTIARFMKMNGYSVIHPMGWDAFGLPAENAAFDRNIAPQKWTNDNILKMKSQLTELGCVFDWDREINTSDPTYYKWTQVIFLELFKSGLVYQKESFVNWDPVDQTVLADEQVDMNGCSWRSGAKVEKRLLNQWFIKTTHFAKQLYDGLDDPILEDWRDIIQLQKHWIGECDGINVDFAIIYPDKVHQCGTNMTIWTNKPETLLCAKFVAIRPNSIYDKNDIVSEKYEKFKKLTIMAVNPINNDTLPIYITDELIYPEGCDIYLGAPNISDSDKAFMFLAGIPDIVNSSHNCIENIDTVRQTVCDLAKLQNVGGYPVSSKLKDWLISRQRYWGTPIPVIHCASCGAQPVPMEQLPVVLPELEVLQRGGKSPLLKAEQWLNTTCPKCGDKAARETDTMDTFVDSSWYFLRYLDPKNNTAPFNKNKVWETTPVDLYIGGKEHAVLHLYYARFMSHFLHSIGMVPEKEPFKKLLVQGMVMGKSFRIKESGKYIPEEEVKIINEKKNIAKTINTEKPVEILWEKMSKSKYNGVDPSQMFNDYGCDTTRLLILADVSPISNRHWSTATFPGILNWQRRIWLTMKDFLQSRKNLICDEEKIELLKSEKFENMEKTLWDSRNYFISSVTANINFTHQLSVGISRMQGLTNCLRRVNPLLMGLSGEFERALAVQIIMLAPIAPHFACELWSAFTEANGRINESCESIAWDKNVLEQEWPIVDPTYQLDFLCRVDGEDICRIKLLPAKMNNLDKEKAFKLVYQNERFVKKIRNSVLTSSLLLYPNCRSIMDIFTHRM